MAHQYSPDAVNAAIASHNRRPRGGKIGGREARLIHALLKGPSVRVTSNSKEQQP
jgi:hypothetical protein